MVSRNYEEAILSRGMIVLRDDIKDKPGPNFLHKLGEIWTNFYQDILPTLQALFCSIPTRGMTVRQITVVSFRDIVVLKSKIEEALNNNDQPVPKSIVQMFCILLQVRCGSFEHVRITCIQYLMGGNPVGKIAEKAI